MGSGAAEMMFRCVFEGSITMQDSLIEKRPYHRNCKCALHKLKGVHSSTCSSRTVSVSFPKKQPWDDCSLSVSASNFSSQCPLPSSGSLTRCIDNIDAALVVCETEAQNS